MNVAARAFPGKGLSRKRAVPGEAFWQGLAVLLALGFLPLLRCAWGYEQFNLPKVTALHLTGLVALGFAGFRLLRGELARLPLHGVYFWALLFFIVHLMLWPLALSPSLAGDRVTLIGAVLLTVWLWQDWARLNDRRLLATAWTLAAAAGITAFWIILQDLNQQWGLWTSTTLNRLGDWRGELVAGLGNSDFTAMFLATAYGPTLLLYLHQRRKWQAGLLALALWGMAAALILCWSVGNNGALILGAILALFLLGRSFRALFFRRWKKTLCWAAGCLLAVAWLVVDTPLNPHQAPPEAELPGIFHHAFASERWAAGGPTRGVIWLNTMEVIRQNQLTGVGPGNFVYAYPAAQSPFMPEDPAWMRYQGLYTNAAHNTLMQTWTELGPLGAMVLLLLTFLALKKLWLESRRNPRYARRTLARGGFLALLVLVLTSVMSFPLELPVSLLWFFILIALSGTLSCPERMGSGFQMPPVIFEGLWYRLVLRLRGMSRVTALEASLLVPRWGQVLGGTFLTAALLWGSWGAILPWRADVAYHEGRQLEQRDRIKAANNRFQAALALNPDHHDCRSHYSSFLLKQGRFQACLDQLDKVQERLNSSELFLRRAQALQGLGDTAAARRAFIAYRARLPQLDNEASRGGQ